jgi:hypothetical protein
MSAPLSRGLRPIHPGELLREDVLPALGRPKTGIAWPLGISRQTLYDILAERAPGYRADGDPLGQTKRQRAGTVVRVAGSVGQGDGAARDGAAGGGDTDVAGREGDSPSVEEPSKGKSTALPPAADCDWSID